MPFNNNIHYGLFLKPIISTNQLNFKIKKDYKQTYDIIDLFIVRMGELYDRYKESPGTFMESI